MLTGVYLQKKKDQTPLYRASISLLGKRISLGSFPTEQIAHNAYLEAQTLFSTQQPTTILLEQYTPENQVLPFDHALRQALPHSGAPHRGRGHHLRLPHPLHGLPLQRAFPPF